MSKYIDKDKVLEYIIFGVVGKDVTCGELKRAIESLPTIEVNEDCISRGVYITNLDKDKVRECLMEHYPLAEDEVVDFQVIETPSVVPTNEQSSVVEELLKDIEDICKDIRERHVDDSVCGLCEYDADHGLDGHANECPGFERDDCFKLSEEYKAKMKGADDVLEGDRSKQ